MHTRKVTAPMGKIVGKCTDGCHAEKSGDTAAALTAMLASSRILAVGKLKSQRRGRSGLMPGSKDQRLFIRRVTVRQAILAPPAAFRLVA